MRLNGDSRYLEEIIGRSTPNRLEKGERWLVGEMVEF